MKEKKVGCKIKFVRFKYVYMCRENMFYTIKL